MCLVGDRGITVSMTLLDELVAAGERNATTIEGLRDPDAKAGDLEWTRGQLAAHMAAGSEEYLAMASRQETVLTAVQDRAAINRLVIDREAGTPLADLARRLRTVTNAFADFIASCPEHERVGWYEHDVAPNVVAGLYLADMLVHSHDLTGAPLPEAAAAEACATAPHVLPLVLRRGTRPSRARISLRPHGLDATVVAIEGDTATIDLDHRKVDVRVVGPPSTILLSAYGRLTPVQAIRRGMRVRGARAWRVRALQTRFETP